MDYTACRAVRMQKLLELFFSDTDRCRSLIDGQCATVSGKSVSKDESDMYEFRRRRIDIRILVSSAVHEGFRQWVRYLRDEGYSDNELSNEADSLSRRVSVLI